MKWKCKTCGFYVESDKHGSGGIHSQHIGESRVGTQARMIKQKMGKKKSKKEKKREAANKKKQEPKKEGESNKELV